MSWLSAWNNFPTTVNPKQSSGLPELKRQKSVFGVAEAAGICRSGYRKAGNNSTTGGGRRQKSTQEFLSPWPKKAGLWVVCVQSETP